jgi:ABC-type transporter Mla subunit MlaD
MAQIQYSQSSIAGLKEALAALQAQAAAVGTGSTVALAEAINAEIAARNEAINTAISPVSTLVATINGDSTVVGSFRKEIADLIGAAPEALNTLKEIADYISVNPNASVADAINAAIASVNASVAALTATVNANKDQVSALLSSGVVTGTSVETVLVTSDSQPLSLAHSPVMSVLNQSTVRHITAEGVTYDLRVSNGEGAVFIDTLDGYLATEIGTLVGKTVTIEYTHFLDSTTLLP